jgi:hypothetical protein
MSIYLFYSKKPEEQASVFYCRTKKNGAEIIVKVTHTFEHSTVPDAYTSLDLVHQGEFDGYASLTEYEEFLTSTGIDTDGSLRSSKSKNTEQLSSFFLNNHYYYEQHDSMMPYLIKSTGTYGVKPFKLSASTGTSRLKLSVALTKSYNEDFDGNTVANNQKVAVLGQDPYVNEPNVYDFALKPEIHQPSGTYHSNYKSSMFKWSAFAHPSCVVTDTPELTFGTIGLPLSIGKTAMGWYLSNCPSESPKIGGNLPELGFGLGPGFDENLEMKTAVAQSIHKLSALVSASTSGSGSGSKKISMKPQMASQEEFEFYLNTWSQMTSQKELEKILIPAAPQKIPKSLKFQTNHQQQKLLMKQQQKQKWLIKK